MNILALEQGEWTENMENNNADAFRKYKKERRGLGSLFAPPSDEESTSTAEEAPSPLKATLEKELTEGSESERPTHIKVRGSKGKKTPDHKKKSKRKEKKEKEALKKALKHKGK